MSVRGRQHAQANVVGMPQSCRRSRRSSNIQNPGVSFSCRLTPGSQVALLPCLSYQTSITKVNAVPISCL